MPKTRPTAETEGSKAFVNGLERSSNPYPPGELADEWERGWKHASKSRKAYLRHAKKQETLDQERDQMTGLDWSLHKLTPKRLRHYSSSIWVWIALGGVVVFVFLAGGLAGLVAIALTMGLIYTCIAVFVLVQHFAKKHGDKPWKRVLSYILGGVIGLVIILIIWEVLLLVLDQLESFANVHFVMGFVQESPFCGPDHHGDPENGFANLGSLIILG